MVIYSVTWSVSRDLAKGKGRAKLNEDYTTFSVLCRNSKDAIRCLDFHFNQVFKQPLKFTIEDGEITLRRQIVDSRNFSFHYLLMDKMREPLIMSDLSINSLRSQKIF